MRSPWAIFSAGEHYRLESTLLRNDEQLLRAFNELSDWNASGIKYDTDWVFKLTLARVSELDKLLLRAEKNDMLSDVLAGIMNNIKKIDLGVGDERNPEGLRVTSCRFAIPLLHFSVDQAKCLRILLNALEFLTDQVQCLESLITMFLDALESASGLVSAFNVLVSAGALSVVYQYLIGYVDRGGTKTYNSGSFEFRVTYVSLLLFKGAYVWIKFRDVASKRSVYRRSRKDENGGFQYYGKYEPRFKPPREKDAVTGRVLKFDYLPLGGYDTHQDAEVVCQIAGFYYGKDEGSVHLEDGAHFYIPVMSERELGLRGDEKRKWVSIQAKEVCKDFKKEKAARRPPSSNALRASADGQVDARDSSHSEDQAVACLTATVNSEDEFLKFLSELAENHRFDPEILLNIDDVPDIFQERSEGIPNMQESLNQQLNSQKEQLEAEFNRRIAEQQQQHLHIQQRLEDQNLELRQENEHMKSILHQVLKPLRPHFETSPEI